MQFFKGILGTVLFCSILITVLQSFPFSEDELLDDNVEYSEKCNETDSNNSNEKDVDDLDDFLPLTDISFTKLTATLIVHGEFSSNYDYVITSISSPPPKD